MCTARARERGWRVARSLSKRQALTRECAFTRFVPWQAELSHAESELKEANENELPEWDLQLKVNEKFVRALSGGEYLASLPAMAAQKRASTGTPPLASPWPSVAL